MAADDTPGPKKQPRFKGTGAPATAADNNILGDYAALVGNRKVGATAERTTATTNGEVWTGLRWKDTTLALELEYNGTGWVPAEPVKGIFSGSTDANGEVTVNHALGVIPAAVMATDTTGGGAVQTRKLSVKNFTATQIVFAYFNGGSGFASNPVTFHWVAFA